MKEVKEEKWMQEGVDVEFKELDRNEGSIPQSVPKEIVAFANSEGGDLYIGISDDGTAVGVKDTDDTMKRLSRVAHDTILPSIIPFIQISPVEIDGKEIVKLSVAVGTERPYYLKKEGLTPGGVYVRIGSASIPLGEAGIREMILQTSGKSWEESRSIEQNLTFNTFKSEMAERKLDVGETQMRTLKMIGSDGLYTNLALLLSDQCAHTTKVAIFQGTGNDATFRDRCEFSGSLLKQLEDVYSFLDRYNPTKATFSGLRRVDTRDYPEGAVREALLNSIIHRDYLFSGSTIINVFDDRMEFISLGGLVRGISLASVMRGVSQSRNPNLQAVFYRLELVESYGTGIRKIIGLYYGFKPQPGFWTGEGGFTVTLYSRNENTAEDEKVIEESHKDVEALHEHQEDAKASIYNAAKKRGKITRREVEEEFGFSSTKSFNLLRKLCSSGLLEQKKKGYQTMYIPKE